MANAQKPQPAGDEAVMPGSVRLVRLFGFDILIHWSWLIIATLFTWSLAIGYLPDVYPAWGAAERWVAAAITSLLFFSSVLVHELSHSVVARRRGLEVTSITLFVFGGVSSLGGEPRSAREEFWIAVVGPLTSFALAAVFGVVWLVARDQDAPGVAAVTGYLAFINVALGVFNLLPGFPLDGGRVLRSALWAAGGNLLAATRTAATVGKVVAGALIGVGLLSVFAGMFGGLWTAVIGWFLWNAADSSYQQQLVVNSLQGLTAGALAQRSDLRVPPDLVLQQFADQYVLTHQQRAFFVGPEGGEAQGMITLTDLSRAPREAWGRTSVFRAMTPRERLITVTPRTSATEALQMMAEHNVNQLPVLDGRDVTGLLTRAALIRAIQYRAAMKPDA